MISLYYIIFIVPSMSSAVDISTSWL